MYRSNPFCSTKTPGLNMWKHLWTRKRENPKTRKREESTCGRGKRRKRENGENKKTAKTGKTRKRRKPENAKTAKTAKTRKRRKQENRENGENAKTAKTRKRENGENDENPKTAKSVPVFWFSISRFLVFSVFSVFWFSRFLVFSFRWPHPSGQVAFFMCLVQFFVLQTEPCRHSEGDPPQLVEGDPKCTLPSSFRPVKHTKGKQTFSGDGGVSRKERQKTSHLHLIYLLGQPANMQVRMAYLALIQRSAIAN